MIGVDGKEFIVEKYSVTINFKTVSEWMNKINRLSPTKSIISMHFKGGVSPRLQDEDQRHWLLPFYLH